ncbi:hypothetical protein PFISCL1PPCAC_17235, partial [Pristionchus fissidentatus]
RACDDAKDGIHVDIKGSELKECRIVAIHKGILVFGMDFDRAIEPFAEYLSPNIIVFNSPHYIDVLIDENSPLIYILTHRTGDLRCPNEQLIVLDTKTLEILTFELGSTDLDVGFSAFIGLREGVISFRGEWRNAEYVYYTELQIEARQFEQAAIESE